MEDQNKIKYISTLIAGEQIQLHPFRGVYWEKEKMLLLADLHLGKAAHFRRSGLPVPPDVSQSNWDRLIALLLDFRPERVVFLGDLFHSDYNADWEELIDLMQQFSTVQFELVVGNHDILEPQNYERSGLLLHGTYLQIGPFLLTHEPTLTEVYDWYNLAGHIHPSVRMRGQGRQRLRLPCFYFGEKGGILPAFGAFTGMGEVGVKKEDRVFVIVDDKIVRVGVG